MGDERTPTAASRVFISYRREESAYAAGWLFERLRTRFGAPNVFKDVDSIPLGDDFVEGVRRAVGSCEVLLAVIGPIWLTIVDGQGRRRLDDPDDFVRLEIETALARGVRVIPVLVNGADMPRVDELPPGLEGLARRQAIELDPARFEADADRLVLVVGETLDQAVAPPPAPAEDGNDHGTEGVASTQTTATRHARDGRGRLIVAAAGAAVALILAVELVTRAGDVGSDSDPDLTSPEGIELAQFDVEWPNDPPLVGDVLTVRYSFTNTSDSTVRLESFVAVRDDEARHLDTGYTGERELLPGDTTSASASVPIESAGWWKIWACYELDGGGYCPDEWHVVPFLVTEPA